MELHDIENDLHSLMAHEFRDAESVKKAMTSVIEAINELKGVIDVETDETKQRIEARNILRKKIDNIAFYSVFGNKEKDMIANLAIKYEKDIPSDGDIREYINIRIMDLDDESVLILAYGLDTIAKLGSKLADQGESVYERGLQALKKDAFLPSNIEQTYGAALKKIFDNKAMLFGFIIDYFRRKHV